MRFGCCSGLDRLTAVAKAGYDYIEPGVRGTVAPLDGPEKFEDARRRPDDFPEERTRSQLEHFLRLAGDAAQQAGLQIAIEPLNQAETNTINTVAEGLDLALSVKHPGVHVLADLYHMAAEGESYDVLQGIGGRLIHVHLAEPPDRTAPGAVGYDFRPFFGALSEGGYRGRISVECRWQDSESELPRALEVLRTHWDDVAG